LVKIGCQSHSFRLIDRFLVSGKDNNIEKIEFASSSRAAQQKLMRSSH
jgi:hypothetical protein